MATIRGRIVGRGLARKTIRRSAVQVGVEFIITDGGQDQPPLRIVFSYNPLLFRGKTPAEIRTMLRDDGAGGVPSLRSIAVDLLQDYHDAAPLRNVTLPLEFGP